VENAIEIWKGITLEEVHKLYDHLPRRVAALLAAHRSHTKY